MSARADWRTYAACRQDPQSWEVLGTRLTKRNREAMRICDEECPVRRNCEAAYENLAFDGVIVAGRLRREPLRVHVPLRANGRAGVKAS
jgi:hypothetical protein